MFSFCKHLLNPLYFGLNIQQVNFNQSLRIIVKNINYENAYYIEPNYGDAYYIDPDNGDAYYTEPNYEDTNYIDLSKEDTNYVESSKEDTNYIEPSKEDTNYVESSKEDTDYIDPSNEDADYIDPSEEDTNYVDPSNEDTNYIEPSKEDTNYTEPNYEDAYYIDPNNGDDRNLGTVDSPFQTIQKGIDMAAENTNDSNQIYLKGGTYNLTESLTINNQSGEENAPLTIQSAPQEAAIIDGQQISNPIQGSLISIRDSNHVNIAGLEVRNAPSLNGIEVINGNEIEISNNRIHDTDGMGIRVRGYTGDNHYEPDSNVKSSNVLIKENEVTRTNLSNSGGQSGNWGSAIQAWNANNVSIVNNTVGQNYGEGISLNIVDNARVTNNMLYDNFSVQVYLDNVVNSIVEANFINHTGDREYDRDGYAAKGIAFANEIYNIDGIEQYHLNNNLIRRNVIANAKEGFYYGTWGGMHQDVLHNQRGFKNTVITHNTVYDSQSRTIRFDEDSQIDGVYISNNIFSDTESKYELSSVDNLTGVNFHRNLWFGKDAGDGYSSTDISADPIPKNPGGSNLADYQLTENSAAINVAGSNSDNIYSIVDGEADLGAIEYGEPLFNVGNLN